MQPNAQGWCESYYGKRDINVKPKIGVIDFMLDEHVLRTVEKEKDRFTKEVSSTIASFNKLLKEQMKKNEAEMKKVHSSVGDLTRFMYKIVDINKLKEPELEKKAKKKPEKIEILEEDDSDEDNDEIINGYL